MNRFSVHTKPVSPLTETASFPRVKGPLHTNRGEKKCAGFKDVRIRVNEACLGALSHLSVVDMAL